MFFALLLFALPSAAFAVGSLSLIPPADPVGVGDEFLVRVVADPGTSAGIDGVEAYVDFDPAVLEVLEIVPGTALPTVLASAFDNAAGTVDHTAGTLTAVPNVAFDAFAIRFRAVAAAPGGTALALHAAAPRRSNATFKGSYLEPTLSGASLTVLDTATPVTVALVPSSSSVLVGAEFDVVVEVRTGTRRVDGAAAYLDFDPSQVQVVGITPGRALPELLEQDFDNATGRLGFAAGRFADFPSGAFILATVRMRALASTPAAALDVSVSAPRQTDVTFAGRSLGVAPLPAALEIRSSESVVRLALSPAAVEVGGGEFFDLEIRVQSEAQPVDGAAAFLDFDAAVLQVVSVAGGTSLPTTILDRYDNTAGTVDFVAGALGNLPSGDFVLATVRFRTRAATAGTAVTFTATNPRRSDATYGGASVLGELVGANVVVTATDPGVWLEVVADPQEVAVGDEFDLVLQVRAGTQPVDGAAAFVEVDPAHVRLLDLMPGSALGTVLRQRLDSTAGTVELVAGELGTLPAATFELGRIRARALAATDATDVTLLRVGSRTSDVTYGGGSVLTDALSLSLPIAGTGVQLVARPASAAVRLGETIDVALEVWAGTRTVDGVAAYLDFDPKIFAVESVTSSGMLPVLLRQRTDAARGRVDFIAGTFGDFPGGTFTVATIRLRAVEAPVEGPSRLVLSRSGSRRSDATLGGLSVLDTAIDGRIEVTTGGAVLAAVPEAAVVPTGRVFRMDLEVRAGGDPVDGAAAYLEFDPTVLEAVRVVGSGVLPQEIAASVDNDAGRVSYVAGAFDSFPSGNFSLATVEFLAKRNAVAALVLFEIEAPRRTDVAFAGSSLLAGREGATVAIAGPSCLLDLDASGDAPEAATDGRYLFRHLAGLPPVPSSVRSASPGIPENASIAALIDALGLQLDFDADGVVSAATDAVYATRLMEGREQIVPADFGVVAGLETEIVERIYDVCCLPELGCLRDTSGEVCIGDCGGNGVVSVEELIRGVSIALGTTPMSLCRSLDANVDQAITVDELLLAMGQALYGCGAGGAQ